MSTRLFILRTHKRSSKLWKPISYYLPHHAVTKESSKMAKRVVIGSHTRSITGDPAAHLLSFNTKHRIKALELRWHPHRDAKILRTHEQANKKDTGINRHISIWPTRVYLVHYYQRKAGYIKIMASRVAIATVIYILILKHSEKSKAS